jgi:hypothetical protein
LYLPPVNGVYSPNIGNLYCAGKMKKHCRLRPERQYPEGKFAGCKKCRRRPGAM